MKKITKIVLILTLLVVAVVAVSPLTFSVSNDPCARCHSSRHPYSQYLDILEGDTKNQVPTILNLNEPKTVTVVVQNLDDVDMFSTLTQVSLTLSSSFGHFKVSNPTYTITNMPVGTATATWQITGNSDGYDYLTIQATGYNSHGNSYFYDSYSPIPLITVGSPTGTPPPLPTPTPAPPSTPAPATPQPSSSTPTQTSTPAPTTNPSNTPQPSTSPSTTLSIELISPAQSAHIPPNSKQTIQWQATGGSGTLKVKLEFIINNQQWITITTDQPASGTYQWITPETASTVAVRATVQDATTQQSTTNSFQLENTPTFDWTIPIVIGAVAAVLIIAFVVFKLRAKKPS